MRLRLLAALCGLTILMAAPVAAQTLHVALREDPDVLDPTLARSYVGRIVFAGLCDKLFDIDENLHIVPQLALSYEWADPKTLILHLRPNVTFQDGEPFDAAAVKYGLERHMTMQGSFRRSEISVIDHVEVVDPLTVRLVLKSPSSPLVAILTDRSGMIVAPKAAQAEGRDFGLHPVCNGPFKFAERVAQDRIVLDRFPGYWDAKDIHFDHVIYQPMPDSAVQDANLRAGSIDLAERVLPTDVAELKKDPKLRIVTGPSMWYGGITFNLAHGDQSKAPIGQSALLRQAFEAAIDRQALGQVVFNGMYLPTIQAVPPSSPFYVPGFEAPPRDLAKAIALVKQSGLPTPIHVTMNVPNTSDSSQEAEVIQSMVRDAGFDLKINLIEFASSLSAAAQGDFQSYLIGWSGRADADGDLYVFLHSGAGQNDGHYSNPIVDTALDTARTLTDTTARRAQYATVLTQERKDLPIIYLFHPVNIVALSTKISGFRSIPDGMIRLQGLSEFEMKLGQRIAQIIPTMILVSVLVFCLQQLMPGDPALVLAGEERSDPRVLAQIRAELWLDRPLPVQYLHWVGNVVQGNLGYSWHTHEPVAKLIEEKLPVTAQLGVMAFIISVLIGVPAGVVAAVKRNGPLDYVANVIGLAGLSMPNFWLGIMLILLVSVDLGWLPPSGYVPLTQNVWQSLATTIMPAFVLGNAIAAILMRHTRSAMLSVLDQDYVRTARAKGLSNARVVLRHALRNALIPVVTLGALEFGSLLSGAVLTEQVFSIPGFGKMVVDAVFNRDYPVVQGVVLVTAFLFILLNLLADILYVLINPRLRRA